MKAIYLISWLLGMLHLKACTFNNEDYVRVYNDSTKISRVLVSKPVYEENQKLAGRQIPILCYHNIKPHNAGKPGAYSVSTDEFRTHIKMLSDSGYNAVLPDQLFLYLTAGVALPPRPVMITFDDSHEEHFTIAAPILSSYGFRAVFFVMAVTIGEHGYLSAGQIKSLSDNGHRIGCHTWDHQNLTRLDDREWELQVVRPRSELERITGQEVRYLAYPFGAWNEHAVSELKRCGIKAAFQLSGKQSEKEPIYTIRRVLIPGTWSAKTLYRNIHALY